MIHNSDVTAEVSPTERQGIVAWLPIDKIDPHPANPRDDWSNQEIDALAASLDSLGMIQPITVRASAERGRYQLIAGERRFRATKKAGLKTIRAIVRICSDEEALMIMLAENVERRDLNPLQKAKLLERMCSPVEQGGLGKTQVEVSQRFGHDRSWAANVMRLLKLPPVWQQRVQSGEVAETMARSLVKYVDRPEVLEAANNDYEMNRWAWRTREDFERNAAELAADPNPAPRAPRLTPVTESSNSEDLRKGKFRRSDSAGENLSRERSAEPTVDEVLAFVRKRATAEDLKTIQKAITRQLKRMTPKLARVAAEA